MTGLLGGYSRAFDLVSSQYGWTDKTIKNLTVGRFRQITSAIQQRQYFESRRAQSLVSWQTRLLAQYIAGGYMTDGKGNPALDGAGLIAFDEIEEKQLEESAKLAAEQPVKAPEPKPGSYERAMASLGSPSRWK